MVYNYLDDDDLSKMPAEKSQLLFKLLEVKSCEEIAQKEITNEYLQSVSSKVFSYKKSSVKKDEFIELSGLKKEEQELLSDIIFLLKEILNEDKFIFKIDIETAYAILRDLTINEEDLEKVYSELIDINNYV